MRSLPEWQAAVGGALLNGVTAGRQLMPGVMFSEPEAVVERRLAAYRRNVNGNWRSALASTYPVVAQLLGQQRFRQLADRYSADYPSGSGDLNAYGHDLAMFLEESPLRLELPYLPDMARLEWALLVAYGAVDDPAFDLAALAAVPVARHADVLIGVWAGTALIESPWSLVDLWQAHQLAKNDRDAVLAGIDISSPLKCRGLVVRSEGRVSVLTLGAGEAVFLRALQSGQPLGQAIVMAMKAADGFNPAVALHRFINTGTLTGFTLPASNRDHSNTNISVITGE